MERKRERTSIKMPKLSHNKLTFLSKCLGRQTSVNIMLPFGSYSTGGRVTNPPFKAIWLLHGMGDDYNTWMRLGVAENLARDYGIALIMPDGGNSFYTDMAYGGNYYSFIVEELPRVICDTFRISDKKEDNFIAGFSMGGYGALKIGILNSDRFSAVGAFSSVADIAGFVEETFNQSNDLTDEKFIKRCKERKVDPKEAIYAQQSSEKMLKSIFGEKVRSLAGSEHDLFKLYSDAVSKKSIPNIYMSCGVDDFLIDSNNRFNEFAKDRSDKFFYETVEGAHFFDVWNQNIEDFFYYLNDMSLIEKQR